MNRNSSTGRLSSSSSTRRSGPQSQARRTDIQSLRALAIGLVVAAHAHAPWLQGGYVGVDVFFVLSGYLISGLVLREVEATGHFNAWQFYARRIKRLFPAMLLVLLATATISWFLVSPLEQVPDASAAESATIWLSNFYFAAHAINYFSSNLTNNLFLHMWSLAVEEQFYLVWPWSLLFIYGVWDWQGAPMSRKRLGAGLGIIVITSLVIAVYWSLINTEAGFYLMPGRAWEFALGAVVYLLREAMDAGRFSRLDKLRGQSLLNGLGWLVILLVSVVYSDQLRYPGLWATIPCMGAALVLLDAPEKKPEAFLSRIAMRTRLFQFIGDISYSLYLWHWPVLVIGNEIFGQAAKMQLILVILSVGLASATYYSVERPIHRAPLPHSMKVFFPAMLCATLGFFGMGIWQDAVGKLLQQPAQRYLIFSRLDVPAIYEQNCDTWYHSAALTKCAYGAANARHTVVMFGDSILAQWYPAVSNIFLRKADWRVVVLTKSACPASQISFYYDMIKANYTVCDVWRKRALDYIVRLQPDVVLMGSSARYPFSSNQWINGTRAVLDRLSPSVHSIVIMSPTPELGFDGVKCLSARNRWPHWIRQIQRCQTTLNPLSGKRIADNLQRAARRYPNVHVIDLHQAICPDDICRARLGRTIVYRDGLHMTASFARSLVPSLQQSLQAIRVPQ